MKLSLKEFIDLIPQLERQMNQSIQQEVVNAGDLLVEAAQNKIGHYQEGWEQLARSTQEERDRLGYPANEPLLRDGTLRDSYTKEVGERHLRVGSTDPVAEYQEVGTGTIPPRPVILPAVMENMDAIRDAIGNAIVDALSGKTD